MRTLTPPALLLAMSVIVACGDDDPAAADAATAVDATAATVDAAADLPDAADPADAAPGADAAICADTLLITSDGTTIGIYDIIISEISIAGDYVELFNTTDTDIALTGLTAHKWCAFPSYADVSADAVTVPGGGFATIPFPLTGQTEAAGELVLYANSMYTNADSVLDYVCWGAGGTIRKAVAESAGKWSGACAAAIPTGGALHRNQAEEGNTNADYSASDMQTPLNCRPL